MKLRGVLGAVLVAASGCGGELEESSIIPSEGGPGEAPVIREDAATTLSTGKGWPTGIAVDESSVYAAVVSQDRVMKVPVAGGTTTTVVVTQPGIEGVTVDESRVYWTTSSGTVASASKSGGPHTLIADSEEHPRDIVIDASSVHWTNYYSGGTLKSAPKEGGSITTLFDTDTPDVQNGLTRNATHLFWRLEKGDVMTVPLAGGPAVKLASGPFEFDACSVAADAESVYWTVTGSIMKMPLAGGGAKAALVSGETPVGIALNSDSIYWVNADGAVKKAPKGGGDATTLTTGNGTFGASCAITVDAESVYWLTYIDKSNSGWQIRKISK